MFRWQPSGEPFYVARWERLRNCAVEILTERELAYPSLVAEAKMRQDQADDGIRIARAIAADWQRIVDLRAGRAAAALDRTATEAEKLAAYAYFHRRSAARLEKLRPAFAAALPTADARAIESEAASLFDIYEAWKQGHPNYSGEPFTAFFTAGRRYGATDAMLWLAERTPSPMAWAEIQAALIERARPSTERAA